MEGIGAYEAKTHLPRLLAEVEQGKSFEITKHGRAVARLTPSGPQRTPAEAVQAATLVDQLPLITSDCPDTVLETLQTALQHNLTPWDATYLVMAMQGGFTLTPLDQDLRRAVLEVGVKVLPDEDGG